MKCKVSIVVPVKNGLITLKRSIEGIKIQTLYRDLEVVAVDSGSTDGSVEFLKQFEFVKLIEIDPETFNHGATRNLAVEHCQGDFIFMTVQDAWTEDPQLLERMVIHFNDSEVMGVCGQQIVPHELDKNPHEWFRPQNKPSVKTIQFKPGSFEKLSPQEQRFSCGWDDVIAMYRKSALIATPFEPLIFGEDMLWAKTALEKGYKLVYDTSARVNHYHYQFQDFTRKRALITKLFIYKVFNFKDYEKTPIKNYFLVIYRNLKWRIHPKWILHNFSIIYQHRKATKEFIHAVESNLLIQLEEELSLNIPKGQSIKKSISHAK